MVGTCKEDYCLKYTKGTLAMTKKMKIISILICLSLLLCGCSMPNKTNELQHEQFCSSADGAQNYDLNSNDRLYIIDILNNASWVNDLTNCDSDFVFCTQKQKVRYHSECGTFNDYSNQKSTTVSEEQRAIINSMLGIN